MGTTLLIITLVILALVLLAFWQKLNNQFKYLHLKEKKKLPQGIHLLSSDLDDKQKDIRNRALMLFPLLFGVDKSDEGDELNRLKDRVRSLHFAIFLLLMAIVILGLIGKGPVK
jgi:NhaP-type Na+/H+ or K+/H+ antiporter